MFAERSRLPKAFYYPTRKKHIKEQVCLSPERLKKCDSERESPDNMWEVREDGEFFDESSSKFDESWPTTDRIKQVESTHDEKSPEQMDKAMKDPKNGHSSTLSRYIQRFRSAPPTKKKDRSNPSRREFWWLTNEHGDDNSALTQSKLRDHAAKIEEAMEKTQSSTNSIDPVVSTDGLGSTASSQPTVVSEAAFEEPVYRPQFTRAVPTTVLRPSKPEDDILVQWRRRRKLEDMKIKNSGYSAIQHEGAPSKLDKYATSWTADENLGSKLVHLRQRLQGLQDEQLPADSKVNTRIVWQNAAKGDSSQMQSAPATNSSDNTGNANMLPATNVHPSSQNAVIASPCLHTASVAPHHHLTCDILPCPAHPSRCISHQVPDPSRLHSQVHYPNPCPQAGSLQMPGPAPSCIVPTSMCNTKMPSQPVPNSMVSNSETLVRVPNSDYDKSRVKPVNCTDQSPALVSNQKPQPKVSLTSRRHPQSDNHYKDQYKVQASAAQNNPVHPSQAAEQFSDASKQPATPPKEENRLAGADDSFEIMKAKHLRQLAQEEQPTGFDFPETYMKAEREKDYTDSRKQTKVSQRGQKEKQPQRKELLYESQDSLTDVTRITVDSSLEVALPKPKPSMQTSHRDTGRKKSKRRISSKVAAGQKQGFATGEVQNTISDVVADRLMGRSFLESSVDTMASTADDGAVPSANELESALCSDGEDFREDDILQTLRQRRKYYLQKLHEIDALLTE